MGISGLHPVIKPFLQPIHVREYQGLRLGVDAWSWLHRGAVGAARELATGTRPWEQRGYDAPYVTFCLRMAAVLKSAGATPVLVFDGCRLPAKAGTNAERRRRRSEARERALKLLEEGQDAEAQGALMQCIDVTADMAHEVIVRLRERGVEFVVAPYEADPQLAYLCSIPEHEGGVSAVVTEDSDLVAYGCRHVLFKMDTSGHCLEFSLDRLFAGPSAAVAAPATAALAAAGSSSCADGSGMCGSGSGGGSGNASSTSGAAGSGKRGGSGGGTLSLRGWNLDMLQAACVLAGCDFLPSLKGISFRTAASFVGRRRSLEGALKAVQAEKRFRAAATQEYCAAAAAALLNFKHALVFCPNTAGGSVRRLNPLPNSSQQQQGSTADAPASHEHEGLTGAVEQADLAHLGAVLDAEVARGIAYGYLHPHTLQPFSTAATGGGGGSRGGRGATPQRQHGHPSQHAEQPYQQQHHHHHHQQQQRPSIHGRRQLGSWVVAGAAHQPGLAGLGPLQQQQGQQAQQQHRHHHNHYPHQHHYQHHYQHQNQHQQEGEQQQQQRRKHMQQQQQQRVDVSDVLQLYQPAQQQHPQQQRAAPGGQGNQQLPAALHAVAAAGGAGAPAAAAGRCAGRQPAHNPFARQQAGSAAAAAATAGSSAERAGGVAQPGLEEEGEAGQRPGSWEEAVEKQASAAAGLEEAAAAAAGSPWQAEMGQEAGHCSLLVAAPSVSQCSSWQGPAPPGPACAGPGAVGVAAQGSWQQGNQQQRLAMQAITNQQAQQAQRAVQQLGAAACAAAAGGGALEASPAGHAAQAQQAQQAGRVWDSREQYHRHPVARQAQRQAAWATPPAAVAGSKRKISSSSGGGGGGSAGSGSKKGARPLAPPAQRISRFFAPAPKPKQ